MAIMQTEDAARQRAYIESKGLGEVIFSHEQDDTLCVQYHPKEIKGGMIPEIDSHSLIPPRYTSESQPCNIPLLSVARLRTWLQLIQLL